LNQLKINRKKDCNSQKNKNHEKLQNKKLIIPLKGEEFLKNQEEAETKTNREKMKEVEMGGSGIKDLFGGAEKEQQIKKDEKSSTRN
jgi:hypothetical protein